MLAYFFKVFNNHFRKYDDIFSYIYIIREKTNKVNTGFARIIDIFLYDKKTIVLGDIEKTITNPDFKIEDIVMLTEDNYLEF